MFNTCAAPEPHVPTHVQLQSHMFNTCSSRATCSTHVQLQSHIFNTCAAPEPHVQHMCSSRATCSNTCAAPEPTYVQLQSHMFNTCAAPEPHVSCPFTLNIDAEHLIRASYREGGCNHPTPPKQNHLLWHIRRKDAPSLPLTVANSHKVF